MTSYFDELGITSTQKKKIVDVDLDAFMNPTPASQHSNSVETNVQQLIQTANFFNQFREQMQTEGNVAQEEFLDNLVSQLLEESQNDIKGPPPASKRFINALPNVRVLNDDDTCIICKDNLMQSSNAVTRMPCGHLFDKECIIPWLELHNTCPMCRYQVETEEKVKQEEEEERQVFATRSNLKRHMENPNIHNIPYIRSRDQKRWKGHSKKIISKEETTESNNDRMRKWRAENREKNRQNDLRCRVYRLARQKFGDHDSPEKQGFVREEIARRLGRRMMLERKASPTKDLIELPFYSGLQQKIELPSIHQMERAFCSSSPLLPDLSPTLQRRTSSSSSSSNSSVCSNTSCIKEQQPIENSEVSSLEDRILPSMHTFFKKKQEGIKYVNSNRILDEFVGVVLNYVDNSS
ncbi:hypothetical protein G6F57_002065 [Rhizopus arrhizus]|uniref:RING-type domain-containing protein n=1 Tax=Rhizopus oryzae TaxID=64495 RepID=A0A9P7BY09_RHIOR|nr:hypothetical protein G6F23_011243 [Rhizopus arrhizus]KAG0795145.1 hypothetical protein G6F21_002335 [Rhizopus arrhizus]KAG0819412.1 hypothetical protein G6F20_000796 [Rhizopus arrhizus]KAG0838575.1 hypothetical protein G6F19_003057 [Rhizopus arrhizus]KAG0858751.1 hypothetical protein G6F17_002531 [Rhizopus arrhizus]